MNTLPGTWGTRRDDVDRALIVAPIVLLWLAGGVVATIPAVFAAFALYRHAEWARRPLVVSGLAVTALAIATRSRWEGSVEDALFLAGALSGVLVAVAAARVRIGPAERRASPRTAPTIEETARPPTSFADVADDPALLGLLDRIAHLDREELRELAAAWRAVAPADREGAWVAVRRALRLTGRDRILEDVREQIELWGRAAGGSPWTWQFGTMTDVDRGNERRAAMPALLDAAAAIIARDRLDDDELAALGGPWDSVVAAEPATA